MKKFYKITLFIIIIGTLFSMAGFNNLNDDEKQLSEFIKKFESLVVPIIKETSLSSWNAAISGKEEDFKKVLALQNKLTEIYSDKENFSKLKAFKESGNIKDALLYRQLEVLYLGFLGNQADLSLLNQINELQNSIEQKYGNFRTEYDGKAYTDNSVEEILTNSTDSKELEGIWTAQKRIGNVVSEDVRNLAKLRNKLAQSLGFKNFHEMSLTLSQQNPADITKLFDELDELTKDAFKGEKDVMDEYFANRFGINKTQLKPWHYQNRFFQEAPKIYKVDLDGYYKNSNLEKLTSEYYNGINMSVDDLIKNSDLYEKPGKNQHAFCTDIDNIGDIRVLCNIKPNEKWMNTMLHEFGHAAYDKYIDINLPYFLRNPAHTFTTEAIAMVFGRFSSNGKWLKDELNISDEEYNKINDEAFKMLRLQQLVFSRWAQVMYNFEKNMYENPEQDLNALWWNLVEKYQLLKKPEGRNEPDWATKIHIALYPCYYHNYLMGELLASQLYYYINTNILKADDLKNQSWVNKPEVGNYLKANVFAPGQKYYWNDMIEKATGEKLTAKYYAKQFVK